MIDASGFSNSVLTYFLPIAQLIILFLQERREGEAMTLEAFGQWLDTHHFSDIKNKLDESKEMQVAITSLLEQNREETLTRFNFIDAQLAKISSQIDGFSEIARIVQPDAILSDQAMNFLSSFADSDVKDLFAVMRFGETIQIVLHRASRKTGYSNDTSNIVEITEARFAAQDLEELANLNLIQCENPYAEGGLTYRLTRQGDKFLRAMQS